MSNKNKIPTLPKQSNLATWVAVGLALTGVGLIICIPVAVVIWLFEQSAYQNAWNSYCEEMSQLGLEPQIQ